MFRGKGILNFQQTIDFLTEEFEDFLPWITNNKTATSQPQEQATIWLVWNARLIFEDAEEFILVGPSGHRLLVDASPIVGRAMRSSIGIDIADMYSVEKVPALYLMVHKQTRYFDPATGTVLAPKRWSLQYRHSFLRSVDRRDRRLLSPFIGYSVCVSISHATERANFYKALLDQQRLVSNEKPKSMSASLAACYRDFITAFPDGKPQDVTWATVTEKVGWSRRHILRALKENDQGAGQ